MLRLERYGVVLRQIGPDDIEQVRLWRNDPEVARYMAFRDHITPEMQQRWYEGVVNRGDLYFIVSWDGRDIGVANLKDIDRAGEVAEGGIFIVRQDFRNSHVPYRVSLCLLDYAFEGLKLKRVSGHILEDNSRAIRYNKSLGFAPTTELTPGNNRLYYLERDVYELMSKRVRTALKLDNNPPEQEK